MKYHGISQSNLADAPLFEDVSDRILTCLEGILVGYSVEFDYMFLKRYYKNIGTKLKKAYIDIAVVEQWLDQECGRMNHDMTFESILGRYGLRACHRHDALADAFFAAQIFQLQLVRLMSLGMESSEGLIKAINRCVYAIW
jgi:DNA polymerase III subunit epsilon